LQSLSEELEASSWQTKDNMAADSVVTNTQFIAFKYFDKYLHSDDYLNTIAILNY